MGSNGQEEGDIRDSCADISAAIASLGYSPKVLLAPGLKELYDFVYPTLVPGIRESYITK